jgi:NAD(P)-dependent dehydrogenase (short-subunit alcohol dehydrogenase family)
MFAGEDFDGKVALVTGAGTGMGAATAELLAGRGVAVGLVGRHEQPLRDVEAAITAASGSALVIPADVTDPAAMLDAVSAVVEKFGGLHYGEVDNIAAGIPAGRIGEPREIATAVAFLLSGEASYITGAHLAVDGGFLI